MRRNVLEPAGLLLLLAVPSCSGATSRANVISLEEASVQKGEFFPQSLYGQSAGCSKFDGLPKSKPVMVLNDFEQHWFSEYLAAAGEMPLIRQVEGKRALFRFIWLPSFNQPVVIRIETANDGQRRIVATRLSGAGGYEPGAAADKIDRRLTQEEGQRIDAMISGSKLLEQPSGECQLGLDGAEWIVEAIDGDGYHFLKRWSPQEGPVREFGLLLLKMTGWKFKEVY
jgi:hypothetical protein